jgi:hypothetical protein
MSRNEKRRKEDREGNARGRGVLVSGRTGSTAASARKSVPPSVRIALDTIHVLWSNPLMANAMAQMTATMQQMTDAQIREAVEMISAAPLNADSRFVRAHLIEEYIRRNGEQAGDELMTAVGL